MPSLPSLPANYLTATETLARVRSGELTVSQIVDAHLQRLDERDAAVHAWAFLDRERVRQEAKRMDQIPEGERGPLHGVVVGIKDVMYTKDMPTEHGSPIFKDCQPGIDASCVAVLRSAGALIYGKAHTTEFAIATVGPPTRHPMDPARTPGGSSSGSAAAVGDWQCHVALGTQTIGSMIRPGSFNGIFAFKPTWGVICRDGAKASSYTLDTVGIFARSVPDLQLLATTFDIRDDEPLPSPPKPLAQCSFAFIKTDQWATEDAAPTPELIETWDLAHRLLSEAGAARIVDLDLPSGFDGIRNGAARTVALGENRENLVAEYRLDPAGLHPSIRDTMEDRPERMDGKKLGRALDRLAALRPKIDALIREGGFDAIVTPSTPGQAPVGTWTGDSRFCAMWTALHVPVVNIPGFAGPDGMPVGLSLVAPRYEDERLLQVAGEVARVFCKDTAGKLRKGTHPGGALRAVV